MQHDVQPLWSKQINYVKQELLDYIIVQSFVLIHANFQATFPFYVT